MQWPDAIVCGIDEAGRGPLAGPVFAAAVILDPNRPFDGLRDSKAMSATARETVALRIREQALAFAVAEASVEEIDRLNILQATFLAMRRAVAALPQRPPEALVDGNRLPGLDLPTRAIIKGDASVPAIAAASILAKTARDACMLRLHGEYPGYGFDRHMGYPTADHRELLGKLGPCPHHRRSFGPVRNALAAGANGNA